jgi:hypothetical protein
MKQLPKYSNQPNFVGYPLWYVIDDYKCQCNECATISKSEGHSVEEQVNWDDSNLWCDECSEKIESAYADEEDDNPLYSRDMSKDRQTYI